MLTDHLITKDIKSLEFRAHLFLQHYDDIVRQPGSEASFDLLSNHCRTRAKESFGSYWEVDDGGHNKGARCLQLGKKKILY